jgi:CubicO group peptidase (beta-lactamase class C family)
MKNHILTFLIGFICLNSCKQNSEIAKSEPITNQKTLKLDTLYSELCEKGAFNGSVLIAEDGQIIFEKSYGLANEQTNRKLNDSTIFELASVSKQFTAMGIVQLKKEGKLSYQDDITKYVPELINYEGITIQNFQIKIGINRTLLQIMIYSKCSSKSNLKNFLNRTKNGITAIQAI